MYGLYLGDTYFFLGFLFGLKAFTAAVVGGIGSIPGAMLGGILDRARRGLRDRLRRRAVVGPRRLRPPHRLPARASDRSPRLPRHPEGMSDDSRHSRLPEPPADAGVRAEHRRRLLGRRIGGTAAAAWPLRGSRHAALGVHAGRGQAPRLRRLRRDLPFWLLTSAGDLFNFGLFTLLFIGLGLGLNVDVGFAGLLDLGYVAFFGIGAYTYALALVAPLRDPLAGRAGDSDRDGHGDDPGLGPRFLVAPAARRLLRDRHALLLAGVPRVHERDEPDDRRQGLHRRRRTGSRRSIRSRSSATRSRRRSSSTSSWSARSPRRGGSLFRQPVTHGARLARVAGGSARRGGDEHPRQPAQDPRVRLRLRRWPGSSAAIYAAILTAAVSTNYSIGLLIIIYAVVILGGLGSIAGVVVGAIIINCTLRVPRAADRPSRVQALALLRGDHPADRAAEAVVQGRGRPRRHDRVRLHRSCHRAGVRPGRRGRPARRSPARAGSRTGSSSRR